MSVFSRKPSASKPADVAQHLLDAVFDELRQADGSVSGTELKSVGFSLLHKLDKDFDRSLSREEFTGPLAEAINGGSSEVAARLTKEAVQLVVKVHARRAAARLSAERARLRDRGPAALSDAERERIAELKALAPERQRELARAAMRDVLRAAVGAAVDKGTEAATWADEEVRIPMPRRHKFDAIAASVAKVPVAGKAMKAKVDGVAESIANNIVDAATAICFDSRTKKTYVDALEAWVATVSDPWPLVDASSSAFSESLVANASGTVAETLRPVVATVLGAHSLTRAWQSSLATYDAAAKLVRQPGINLNLDEYVMEQIVGSLAILIAREERALRASGGGEGASDAVKRIFGAGQKEQPLLYLPLVLCAAGDPRRLVLAGDAAGGGMTTTGGLSVCARVAAPVALGTYNTVDLGLGHPSTDGGVGVAPRFALEDGKYLTTSLFGAKFFLDVKLGRTTKGTAIALVDEQAWSTYDIAEWTRNADGTLSPASDAKLCAGVTVLE